MRRDKVIEAWWARLLTWVRQVVSGKAPAGELPVAPVPEVVVPVVAVPAVPVPVEPVPVVPVPVVPVPVVPVPEVAVPVVPVPVVPVPVMPASSLPPDRTALRALLEGLRDRTTANGVADPSRLKVVGQDPLPQGAVYGPTTVTLSGGTLDGWDLGGRALVVTGRASATNILSREVPGIARMWPIEISVAGDLEWAENIEMSGPYGQHAGPGAVLNARSAGSGAGFQAGKVRMLRRSRFEGFGADHLKLLGVAGGEEVIEECYFGPQWAPAGSLAHADVFTTVAALGRISLRRNLIEWTDAGHSVGLNNIFRIVRNTGSTAPLQAVRIEENLCFWGPGAAFPIQVSSADAGFEGPVEFVGNWLSARVAASNGVRAWFHPSSAGAVALWQGNEDTASGTLVPGPAGAAAS